MTEPIVHRVTAKTTPVELLDLEHDTGKAEYFADLGRLLAEVLIGALRGQVTASTEPRPGPEVAHRLRLGPLSPEAAVTLAARFDLDVLEANGAWFIPESLRLRHGFVNLPSLAASQPRFCMNLVRDQWAAVTLRDDPDATATWSLIAPMFEQILAPLDLRTATTKPKAESAARKAWAGVAQLYDQLGLDGGEALAAMTYGAGWANRPLDEMIALRSRLLDELSSQVSPETARRWRAGATLQLVRAFQAKAKGGTPLANKVLTKPLQPSLAGLFRGSWVEFCDYLGAAPNDAEQITTALPEPRLYVGSEDRAAEVAAERGLEVDQVQRILASYLGTEPKAVSPVGERTSAMRQWWDHFDRAHAEQVPGTPSLWGLVDDGVFTVHDTDRTPTGSLYRRFVPRDLCVEIERLWDGITAPRWPDKIVSEFHPHRQMAEAFGPALKLWNGVALTCWFICEGPGSRTDLQGLEHYHRRELHELTEMGFGPDPSLLTELRDAESRLGPIEELFSDVSSGGVTMRLGRGSRRDGFIMLRDIVTRHRRAWASAHLDAYLTARWELELREVAREYSRRVAARNKPPTLKQFAGFGAAAANHWFNGDLARLYAALGERSEVTPRRIDLLAGDPTEFGRAVYASMGGGPPLDEATSMQDWEARDRQWSLERFATAAFDYLQRYEVLGRPPTFEEFDDDRLKWDLVGGPAAGWQRFEAAVEEARLRRPGSAEAQAASAEPVVQTVEPTQPVVLPPAGWFPDPAGRFEHRYWDGSAWTHHVARGGQQGLDPLTP